MSSSQAVRSSKYSYRATSTGPGGADVNIEYITDLSSLSRLEVRIKGSPDQGIRVQLDTLEKNWNRKLYKKIIVKDMPIDCKNIFKLFKSNVSVPNWLQMYLNLVKM